MIELLLTFDVVDERLPYAIVRFNDHVLSKPPEQLGRVVNMECVAAAYAVTESVPGVDLSTMRVNTVTRWVSRMYERQIPLRDTDVLIQALVENDGAWS